MARDKRTKTKERIQLVKALGRYSAVGIEMGAAVVIGYLIGHWLDKQAGTAPWLMLFFLLIGVAAGFRGLYRAAKRAMREDEQQE